MIVAYAHIDENTILTSAIPKNGAIDATGKTFTLLNRTERLAY
jgi:hypothetical protein